MVFAWEQLDAGESSTENADKGNNALFRVHLPTSSKSRSFPPLENVLNHQVAKGESLPISERNLTMSFVAQDGFNPAVSDETSIKVLRTGSRFAMNYPRGAYARGNTYPVYWNVANTNQPPINCSSVNLWLSSDGGQTFSYPIARNIPNTGEAQITIPAVASLSFEGRFKIKCSNNIFYAVSYRNFYITDEEISNGPRFSNADRVEENLADLPLDNESENINSVNNVASVSNISNSGGGSIGFLNYLICLILIRYLCTRKLMEKIA